MDTNIPNTHTDLHENAQGVTFMNEPVATPPPPAILPWYEKYTSGIILISIITMIILGSVVFASRTRPKITAPPLPTPTQFPTPTPDRKLSPLSGLQEFRDLDAAVSSYSAHLDRVTLDDPSLVPPVLVLPLGFQN